MNTPVRLLLVEDSADDAKLTIRALRSGGFDPTYRLVQQAAELEAAFTSEPWDAVISDFMMPGFTGIDALRMFRSHGLDVPFILVSGTIGEQTAVDAMKAGASDYVMKNNLARLAPALERELREAAQRATRRKSECDLVESEERFRQLFHGNPLPAWVFDIETLRFLDVNDVACRTYGYTREEFLSLTLRDVRPPEDIPAMESWVRRTDLRALNTAIFRHRKKDGTLFCVEIAAHNAMYQGREARFACVIDVTKRLRAEKEIRKLSQAMEQSPSATVITDVEGRIEYVNPSFTAMSGYAPGEVIGKTPAMLSSGLTPLSVYQELWNTVKSGKSWRGKMRNRRKNGEIYWENEYISPLKSEQGEIVNFIAVKEDITAQLEAEERLRESESRFRELAENIREVFWLTDAAKNQMLYVSPGYEQIWGRSCESLYASPTEWSNAIHAEDRERVLKAVPDQASGSYAEEYRIVRPDGEIRWIRDRAFPISRGGCEVYRIAGIAEDITDGKRAEQQLRESERRYGEILRNIGLVAIMLDRDANITFCNEFLLRLTGWRREEVLGRNWFDLFVPPELTSLRETFAALLEDRPSSWNHENEILTRTGERRLIRWSNTVLRSGSGEVIGTANIGEDISEREKAENEVRRLNADLERRVAERTIELEAANKELVAFDYSVSHDLRAPLNRIRGFVAMLLEENAANLGERATDFLHRIGSAGHDMDQLMGDLLELSTVTAGELRRSLVDVSALAHEVFGGLQRAQPDRRVEFVVEPGMSARADPGLLRIVLENLLGNAWKFTGKSSGARIEIGCKTSDGKPPAFFVRDNGAGFDAAGATKLFAPFQRLHAKIEFEGTGIGLATVQRIVRRHGGRVWAEGAVDKGATFHFTLAP
ncbi:MAG: PAS domain S-box protein [Usitatibacter sp.]